MKKINKLIILFILAFFTFSILLYRDYKLKLVKREVSNYFETVQEFRDPSTVYKGLVFVEGKLYLADSRKKLIKVMDPQTFEVLESFKTPAVKPAGLAWDGEHLWNADFIGGKLFMLSLKGEVLLELKTPLSTPWGLAWDGENLWVSDVYGTEGFPDIYAKPAGIIYTIDTETGEMKKRFRAPREHPKGMDWDGEYLIISDFSGGIIYSFDTTNGEMVDWFQAPTAYPLGVALQENFIWVSDFAKRKLITVDTSDPAELEDIVEIKEFIPSFFWVILFFLLLPVLLEEYMKKREEKVVLVDTLESILRHLYENKILYFLLKTFLVTTFLYKISDYYIFRRITTIILYKLLDFLGYSVRVEFLGDFSLVDDYLLSKNSAALPILFLFFGMCIASKTTFSKRLKAIFKVFFVVFSSNLVRLSLLLYGTNLGFSMFWAHDLPYYLFFIAESYILLKFLSPEIPEFEEELNLSLKNFKRELEERFHRGGSLE
ncbi:MAG: hypothetical protein ACE5K0_00230 [Candidatus Methanofastidiosia archaeon]